MYLLLTKVYQWLDTYAYEVQTQYFNPYIEHYLPTEMIAYPWLFIVIIFILVFIIIPVVIFISLYITALALYVYRNRETLDAKRLIYHDKRWKGLLYMIIMLWEAHGYYWHGYEVDGLHRIPKEGPALIVYYHGCIPLDHFYLMTKIILYKKRFIRSVGDHFLFMVPGSKTLMKELHVLAGPVDECVKLLNEGNLLSIAPGGCREGLFGDNRYKLMWNNRIGFAKVAVEAKVPVIPVFTQNLREAFVAIKWGRSVLKPLYEWTRLPVVPFYGGFPVKMKTFVGKPIPYDPDVKPEELALKTQNAIEMLIKENQRVPGNIWAAICDRY